MIKPDAIGRRLCGEVIHRYEAKGLRLVAMKLQILTREQVETHYAEHKGKYYYAPLVEFMTSGPSIQMVWEGENAIEAVRKLNGATNCQEAAIGSIRGDFGLTVRYNLVHGADKRETAEREIGLYFSPDELWDYPMPDGHWQVID